jgi:hypothetical protein
VTLPGADELFRSTGSSPAPADTARADDASPTDPETRRGPAAGSARLAAVRTTAPVTRSGQGEGHRPTGRERHDEKITVYVSADELLNLERARLDLRAAHGLAVDRGRIVREALAVVLADLEAKGAESILVRRLLA